MVRAAPFARSLLPLVLSALCGAGAHADGQAPAAAPPNFFHPPALETVIVTGSRVAAPLRETPAAVAQLDAEAIALKKPTFIGEVLNTVPGVHMTNLGNEQHSMSIRQPLTTQAVYLYLEDGLPIRPLGLFNHNALYEINMAGVERVEVIRGPAGSLYGSNSVGGTVNFLTRVPSRAPQAELGLQLSDQGFRRADLRASGTGSIGGGTENLGALIAGYVSRRDGGWQDHNDAEKEALTARLDWDVSEATRLIATGSWHHLRTDMPGTLFASDYRQRPDYSYHAFTFREVDAARLSLAWEQQWSAQQQSVVTLFARDNSTEQLPHYLIFNNAADPAAATGRHNDNDFTSLGLDARLIRDFAWHEARLVAGVTAEQTDNEFREDNLAVQRDVSTGAYLGYNRLGNRRDYQVDLINRAAYLHAELAPLPALKLVAGLRHDFIEYDYRNRLLPGPASGAPSEVRDFERFSPKLAATWLLHPDHTLFVNWSQGFTPPEVSSLYGRLVAPALAESVFTNIEAGWRGMLLHGHLEAELIAYQLDGDDEVINYSIAPGNSEPRNAGETRHRGIEAGLVWHATRTLRLDVAAAWNEHSYRSYRVGDGLDYSGRDIPAGPEWLGNVELRWQPAALPGLTAALTWSHLGDYWMNDANTVRYDGHDLLHLRLDYRHGPWNVWLKGENLTDEHYAELASSTYSGVGSWQPDRQDTYTPGAPRTWSLGITHRFGAE